MPAPRNGWKEMNETEQSQEIEAGALKSNFTSCPPKQIRWFRGRRGIGLKTVSPARVGRSGTARFAILWGYDARPENGLSDRRHDLRPAAGRRGVTLGH